MPVIAATGLKFEARIAKGRRIVVLCGGGDGDAFARELERTLALGPSAIISFGVAAGLAPGLAPGAQLVARSIVTERGESFPSDAAWSRRLSALLGGAPIVDLAGLDEPVSDPADKRALFVKTGAFAADMESHVAARIAAAHKLPFAAFRVVLDPSDRQLPPAALAAMQADGGISLGAIARSLLRDPRQIPQLYRIAQDTQAGLVALIRGRKRLAGRFGFSDFGELALDMPAEDVVGRPLQV